MKCEKCNKVNNDESKFCTECGEELNNKKLMDIKLCPSCSKENSKSASFCSNCGAKLTNTKSVALHRNSGNKNESKKRIKRQSQRLNLNSVIKEHKLITTFISAFLIFLVYQSVPKTNEYNSYTPSSTKVANSISNVMSDSVIASVVSKLNCTCGKCTDALDVCTCETAAEERGFIQAKAVQKISAEGILLAVVNKYGGLKSEYSSEVENNGKGLIIPPASNTSDLNQVQ